MLFFPAHATHVAQLLISSGSSFRVARRDRVVPEPGPFLAHREDGFGVLAPICRPL
jgi:hypothetical protein